MTLVGLFEKIYLQDEIVDRGSDRTENLDFESLWTSIYNLPVPATAKEAYT